MHHKTALVTGASSGIGRAIASQLVDAGAKVIGLCRDSSKLPAGVQALPCDLTDIQQIDAAFASIKHLDILVNNAGLALLSRISDGNPADWETMWRLNVQALTICSQKALALFPESGGQIVNTSSMSGHRVPATGGFYSPTKFAVRAISDALRSELRADDNPTRVATVSPGYVDTPLLDHYFKGREEQLAQTRQSIRMLQPDDVASAVLHILNTPLHVEITDIQMRSVDQKS
ncbi:SDR family NAD(P)-dependent oxidoreductase [Verrucomicrobiaceae bacterium N1E253]|uniref:SDR family NAD(P)-dependent oxidoreductase n=1 Tax=Oceaniferula marina TaxID=2748318 RepID=A0A851GKZ4_9BACT|nr:SDR family NAD(P)-dependent oxidoreductase [Oceaniferula marina]NWK55757.1 SDR family NAD(P)-dependent oxidoreductase [Oceaniferula marina]